MTTFRQFVESQSFGLESGVDIYYRLGGDGKKSIDHPDLPGFYIHPNGIVSPDLPVDKEQQPMFDPRTTDSINGSCSDIVKRAFLNRSLSNWE